MADTSIYLKNYRNFRKESILLIFFKPVLSFKSNFINTGFKLIYAELSGDFPLGDSRQPTYKSLRPFDLVS